MWRWESQEEIIPPKQTAINCSTKYAVINYSASHPYFLETD